MFIKVNRKHMNLIESQREIINAKVNRPYIFKGYSCIEASESGVSKEDQFQNARQQFQQTSFGHQHFGEHRQHKDVCAPI